MSRLTPEEVLRAVAYRRPAQATDQITTTINKTRATPTSTASVTRALAALAETHDVIRLSRAEAAECGAFVHTFPGNTSWWISPAHYASYIEGQIDAPDTTAGQRPAPVLPREVSPSLLLLAAYEQLDTDDPMEILAKVERETALDLLTIARRIKLRGDLVQHLGLDFNTAGGEAAAELVGTLKAFRSDLVAHYRHLTGTDAVLDLDDLTAEHTALAPIAAVDSTGDDAQGKASAGTATSRPANPRPTTSTLSPSFIAPSN